MRSSTIVGIVLAAAACVLLLAAPLASAETTLCKSNQDPCPESEEYPEGTHFEAVAKDLTLVNAYELETLETVTCEESVLSGEVYLEGEVTLTGISLSGCKSSLNFKCKGATTQALGTLLLSNIGEGIGTATFSETKVQVSCFFICTYSYGEKEPAFDFLSTTGEKPASLAAKEVVFPKMNAFCPPETTITATYKVTSPTPLYISS